MFEMNFGQLEINPYLNKNIYSYSAVGIPNYFYPGLPFIFRALLWRQKINMNTFILIVGNPRTSKSYCAIKIAEEYSKLNGNKFNVEKQLTFSDIRKFLFWSQDSHDSIFILDETGTSLSPDMFWSLQQRVMRRFVQTQGFRKNILIWVLPSIVFIQKGFRFMSNYGIRTLNQGVVEIHKIVVNQLTGKGFPERIETMRFEPPSKEILEIYERLKKEWNDNELKADLDFMKMVDEAGKPIPINILYSIWKNKLLGEEEIKNAIIKKGFNTNDSKLILDSWKADAIAQQQKEEMNKTSSPYDVPLT